MKHNSCNFYYFCYTINAYFNFYLRYKFIIIIIILPKCQFYLMSGRSKLLIFAYYTLTVIFNICKFILHFDCEITSDGKYFKYQVFKIILNTFLVVVF